MYVYMLITYVYYVIIYHIVCHIIVVAARSRKPKTHVEVARRHADLGGWDIHHAV